MVPNKELKKRRTSLYLFSEKNEELKMKLHLLKQTLMFPARWLPAQQDGAATSDDQTSPIQFLFRVLDIHFFIEFKS